MDNTVKSIREIELEKLNDLMAELDRYVFRAGFDVNIPWTTDSDVCWATIGKLQQLREALEAAVIITKRES